MMDELRAGGWKYPGEREQRSAAAFGESPSSDEEDDFGEGYEAGAPLLTVREDDLQQDQFSLLYKSIMPALPQ